MSAPASIPVSITPDAAAAVAQLGVQAELQQMIDRVRETVTYLNRIDVRLEPNYDTGDETKVVIHVWRGPEAWEARDPVRRQLRDWRIATFRPEVLWHLGLTVSYEPNHAL